MSADGAFQTQDLALASLLYGQGFNYTLIRMGRKKAAWVFVPPLEKEEDFDNLVCDYEDRAARVCPASFVQDLKVVREGLYDFLYPERAHTRPGMPRRASV